MALKRNNNVIDSPGNSFATLNPLFNGYSSWGNYIKKMAIFKLKVHTCFSIFFRHT